MSAPRPARASLVGALIAGAMAASLVTGLRADVESDYGRGWTAFKQGNWKLVIEAMSAAIAQRPDEQGRINIGSNNNQPYLPHYYVGLARFRLGDCRGAIESWKKSLGQGYLRKFRQENEEFSKYFPICEKAVEVETDLAAAQATLANLNTLSRDPVLARVWSSEPELGPAVAKATEQLSAVRTEYDAARREREQQRVTALTAVRTIATSLRKQLEGVEQGARTRQQALVAEARQKQEPSLPIGIVSEGKIAAGSSGSLPRPDLHAPTLPTSSPTPRLEKPPEQLRTGILRFVNGRYREAIETLTAVPSGGRWYAQAALFRSAASFSLYRATNEAQWRARALEAARECARLDPDLQADERLLSPAFRRFFLEAVRRNRVALQTR